MSVAVFGPGIAIVTRTDVTPSTPINVGYCQSLELSLKGSTKDLFGQNQFPLLSARSTVKASGKVVSAVDSGTAMNNMFFGQTFTSGGITWNINEPQTPASGTSTLINHSTFDVDLGVIYQSNLLPLTKVSVMGSQATVTATGTGTVATITFATQAIYPAVGSSVTVAGVTPSGFNGTFVVTASGPTFVSYANATTGPQTVAGTVIGIVAVGQYSISAGVITTNSSDTVANAGIYATYSSTVTGGQSLIVANQPIGFTPTFQLDYYTNVNQPAAKPVIIRVYACISDSLTWSFKLEDFMMPSFDFSFFANAAGKVLNKVYSEVS